MTKPREWASRLRATIRRRREGADADLEEELRLHLDLAAEALERGGASRDDARRAARLQNGAIAETMETLRDQRGLPWLEDLWRDLRYSLRVLAKSPGFSLVVVLTLGLAIGVNNTVFTFVNAILLRGLPFDQPDRIVSLATEDGQGRSLGVSRLDFYDWRDEAHSFSGLAMFQMQSMSVSDEGRPAEQRFGVFATTNMFALIGEHPIVGRDFEPADDQPDADPTAIISYGLWTSRYGSDPLAIGRAIRVNGVAATVTGVMPRGFHFPNNSDVWMPWSTLPAAQRAAPRQVRNVTVFGRLSPGVTLAQARAEMETIGARLSQAFPASNSYLRPIVSAYDDGSNSRWLPFAPARLQLVFYSLWGAVALVLLIACANVASLLLVRAGGRSREIAIRLSLGAGRWRIVRQLVIESVVLAALSGALGFGLSLAGVKVFDAMLSGAVAKPAWMTFPMDARVVTLFIAVCVVTALVFGVAPAVHVSKTDVHDVLKEGGRSTTGGLRVRRWTSGLVVVEIVLTLVLLAGAGFVMRSFLVLYGTDVGVDTSHLLTSSVFLPPGKYGRPASRAGDFYRRFEERMRGVAGVDAVALATNYPLANSGFVRDLAVTGRPAPETGRAPRVVMTGVSPGYFAAVGTRLTSGHELTADDEAPGRVGAVVNQRFASVYFPSENAIGHQVTVTDATGRSPATTATIVGVAPNIGQRAQEVPLAFIYLPYQVDPQLGMFIVLRTPGDPLALAPVIRAQMHAMDPDVPLMEVQTENEYQARAWWPFRVFGSMFGVLAAIALLLSAVGLYAVTSYGVVQRTQEIGVRMALGADSARVLWLVLRRTAWQLGVALPIGIAGALGVGRLLQSFIIRTSGRDPITLAAITAITVVVSVAACLVPARRATRLDPLSALRDE